MNFGKPLFLSPYLDSCSSFFLTSWPCGLRHHFPPLCEEHLLLSFPPLSLVPLYVSGNEPVFRVLASFPWHPLWRGRHFSPDPLPLFPRKFVNGGPSLFFGTFVANFHMVSFVGHL